MLLLVFMFFIGCSKENSRAELPTKIEEVNIQEIFGLVEKGDKQKLKELCAKIKQAFPDFFTLKSQIDNSVDIYIAAKGKEDMRKFLIEEVFSYEGEKNFVDSLIDRSKKESLQKLVESEGKEFFDNLYDFDEKLSHFNSDIDTKNFFFNNFLKGEIEDKDGNKTTLLHFFVDKGIKKHENEIIYILYKSDYDELMIRNNEGETFEDIFNSLPDKNELIGFKMTVNEILLNYKTFQIIATETSVEKYEQFIDQYYNKGLLSNIDGLLNKKRQTIFHVIEDVVIIELFLKKICLKLFKTEDISNAQFKLYIKEILNKKDNNGDTASSLALKSNNEAKRKLLVEITK